MAQTFNCPSCTASLEHDGEDHLTVKCPYCSTTVIVPEALRPSAYEKNYEPLLAQSAELQEILTLINEGKQSDAIQKYQTTYKIDAAEAVEHIRSLATGGSFATTHVTVTSREPKRKRSGSGCIFFLVLFLGFLIPLAIGKPDDVAWSDLPAEIMKVVNGEIDLSSDEAIVFGGGDETESADAYTLFEIGERGISEGQFNDSRGLAVNREGQIYVSDWESGRLQTFSASGEFTNLWRWEGESVTDDVDIDANGVLYAVQQGDIYQYDAGTGESLGQLIYTGDTAVVYDSLAITADNQVYTINRPREQIIHFDANGEVVNVIETSGIAGVESISEIAVDGLNNLYVAGKAEDALGDRHDVIFKFTGDGNFISQFGSSGDAPGTFRGIITSVAVDGLGRIYVGDFFGIQVFDNNGRFLTLIPIDGVAFDMEITGKNELIAISNQNKLYKFDLNSLSVE